ncbi:MAG TPA: hypothetical protein VEK07_17075 [Polyangiaceae bacterium]|nr:hypothetical protein [Polyangiaceae bacterium]
MLRRLHSFGDDCEAQTPGHGYDGVANGNVVRVARNAEDERTIDLQDVNRKPLQIPERRVARAEIVDRDANPHLAQSEQVVEDGRPRHRETALDELDSQGRGLQTRAQDVRTKQLDEARVFELCRCEVDADPDGPSKLAFPAIGLLARRPNDPIAHPDNEPAVLGDGPKASRRDETLLGMLPADQRLDLGDCAPPERHDRLIMQHELAALEAMPDFRLEADSVERLAAHLRLEHLVSRPSSSRADPAS